MIQKIYNKAVNFRIDGFFLVVWFVGALVVCWSL